MEEEQLTEDTVQRLRARWNGESINQIVVTLNEGKSITSIVKTATKNTDIPCEKGFIDLRGIDLSHQNLRGPWKIEEEERFRMGVMLEKADLSHADLSWSLLPRADLKCANLREANLDHTELIFADLTAADLTGANLQGAWLLYTRLHDAVVTEDQLASRRNLGQMDFDYHAYER